MQVYLQYDIQSGDLYVSADLTFYPLVIQPLYSFAFSTPRGAYLARSHVGAGSSSITLPSFSFMTFLF